MWTQGTVLGGRYTLTRRVGGGAMGDVWRADDRVLERQVAVKILLPTLLEDESFAARFRREAKVLAGLDHPGIVRVHDYGEEEVDAGTQVAYIVMEFVAGKPLDVVLRERGPLPSTEALGIAAQALDALHAAHRRGVVHRDVKPANLMVGEDGRVTVTDFGIARALSATKLTAAHEVLGTALYIAPESAEGIATVPASDLYSLGVVLHEMLTGECPFTGETLLEIILKHIREPAPELPEGFPAPVRALVARALEKRPEDRHPSAAAMSDAVRRASDPGSAVALRPTSTLALRATSPRPSSTPDPGIIAGPAGPADAGGGAEGSVPPMPAAPPAVGPAVVIAAAPDAGTVPSGAAETRSRKPPRWRRPSLVFPLVIPIVVASTAGTVLLMQTTPSIGQAGAPSRPAATSTTTPVAAGSSGAGGGGTSGAPSASASPGTGTPGTSAPGGKGGGVLPVQPGGGSNGGANGAPAGGGKGGSGTGSGSGNGGASGSSSGSSSGAGPGSSAGSGAGSGSSAGSGSGSGSGAAAGCGGSGWGAITNVGDGERLGLASGSLDAGTAVVLGGHTAFGWTAVPGVNQVSLHACNANGPALGYSYSKAGSGAELAGADSYGDWTGWSLVQSPHAGAYYLQAPFYPPACLTEHGGGAQVTVETCASGLPAQEWRLP
ncbi:serine/threonine protein kinase [Streptacidiphilus sp. MAP12-33]|uniref:serine/threonine-protein kinase n=1 Tax=Streptacidiphilus sp. MAP12-33 TaxID=3156266 RepID=UPI003517B871